MKMKNRSHRYDIKRPTCRHGHKYSKYKKCLSMMILICVNQHLGNSWSSMQEKEEKFKKHWSWVEKKVLLIKKRAGAYIFDMKISKK